MLIKNEITYGHQLFAKSFKPSKLSILILFSNLFSKYHKEFKKMSLAARYVTE